MLNRNPKNIFEVVKPFSVNTYQSQPEKVQYGPVKQSAAPRQQASGTTASAAASRKNLNSKNIALSRLIGKRGLRSLPITNRVDDLMYQDENELNRVKYKTEIFVDGFEPMEVAELREGLTKGTISYSYDTETGKYTFKKATNGNPKNSLNQAEAQKKYQNDVFKAGYGPVDQQKFQQDIQNGKIHYTYDSDTDEYVFRKGEQNSTVPAHPLMSPVQPESKLNTMPNYLEQLEKQQDELDEWEKEYTSTGRTLESSPYFSFPAITKNQKYAHTDEKKQLETEAFEDEVMDSENKEYVPHSNALTKEEYNKRRASNPSMPEFGSYEYFVEREKIVGAELDRILSITEPRKNAHRYTGLNSAKEEIDIEYADKIASDYATILGELQKYTKGVNYKSDGTVDVEAGIAENSELVNKYNRLHNYYEWAEKQNPNSFRGYRLQKYADENDSTNDNLRLASDKVEAYEYTEEHQDNTYGEGFAGRVAGNYRVGDIGERIGKTGYTSYSSGTEDIEAAIVYQMLQDNIVKRNQATFTNNTAFDTVIADVAGYTPQFINQTKAQIGGFVVGGLFGAAMGNPLTGARAGSATTSALYMFEQTAGREYVKHLQENKLSVEDAKVLATNSALASGAVEFGLEFILGKLWAGGKIASNFVKNGGKAVMKSVAKESVEGMSEKIINTLVKKGMSKTGAKIAVNSAITVGKVILNSLGEGGEEWIQTGMEIVADKAAKKGEVLSVLQIFEKAFDFTQYTEDDLNTMNESFKAGVIIGLASGVGKGSTFKTAKKIINTVSDVRLGGKIKEYKGGRNIIINAIEYGLGSGSESSKELAKNIKSQLEEGVENVSSRELGKLVREAVSNEINVFAVSSQNRNTTLGQGNSNENNVQYLPTAKEDLANGTFGNKQNVTYLPRAVQGAETADTSVEDSRYSIETQNGKKFVRADRQVISGDDSSKWGAQLTNYINREIRKGKDVALTTDDGDILLLTNDTAGKGGFRNLVKQKDGTYREMTDAEYAVKLRAEGHIDELAQISTRGKMPLKADEEGRHGELAEDGWNYRTAYFEDADGKYYRVRISVAYGADGKVVYNINGIQERTPLSVTGSSSSLARGAQKNGDQGSDTIIYQTPQESNPELLPWQKKLQEKKAELGLSVDETGFLPRGGETLAASNELRNYAGELKTFLKQYGISDVVVDERPTSGKVPAYFDPKDGSIHLSPFLDSKEVIARKIAHELVHPAELGDAEVVDRILSVMREMGRDVDAEVAEHKQRYTDFFVQEKGYTPHQAKQTVTDTYAAAETAGDFLSELFGNTDLQNTLAGQNPNFVQRIVQAIRDVIRRLRGNGQNTKQLAQYQKLADDLTAAVERQTGVKAQNSIDENGFGGYNRGTNAGVNGTGFDTVRNLNDTELSGRSGARGGESTGIDTRGINGVFEGNWDKGSRNSSDFGDVSVRDAALESERFNPKLDEEWKDPSKSSRIGLVDSAQSPIDTKDNSWKEAYGRRFSEALRKGDKQTARKILDEYASKSGYVPVNVYHGTRAEEPFTEFKNDGAAHWVTPSLEYAGEYRMAYEGDSKLAEQLFTEKESGIYDLYIKRGNTLDVGYIDKEVHTPADVLEFGKRIGFTEKEILRCWNSRIDHKTHEIWAMTITPEFAEIARKYGYDTISATESDGVNTYGVLYPENIKSAKLETFDDNNELIPLEKRFDSSTTDIRYSVNPPNTTTKQQTRANDTRFSVDTIDADAGYLDSVMEQADRLDDSARTLPTKAVQSKKDLQQKLISDFSIPEGSKKQVNDAVEQFAKTLQQGGTIKQSDVDRLFETLYESGRVEAVDSVSESNKQVRQWFNGSKIYVPDSVKAEFGDDWKDIKASAFGNRIYLVNDPNARGIDSVYEEAQNKFGVFSDGMTDSAEMLREIIHTANEGRTKYVSFAESLKSFGDDAVQDHYDTLHEMFANRIENYIEKANLEMNLKEKNIQEINSLKEHQREMRANQAQRRQESELKTKTFNAVKRLRKMQKKQSPEYRVAIDEVLGNLSTVAKSLTANKEFELRDLKRWATDLEKNENFIPSPRLKRMLNELDAIHIDDLSSYELSVLSNSVFGLEHEIRNRNREIGVEKAREFSEISRKGMDELESLKSEKSHRGYGKYLSGTVKSIENLSPYRALRLLDGFRSDGELTKAAKAFEQGEFKMIDYQTKADKIFEPFMENKENVEWLKTAAGKHAKFIDKKFRPIIGIDETGTSIFGEEQTISFTPMMRVQMYLDLQNRDNLRHVVNGGYKIITKDSYGKNNLESTRPIRLSVQDLKNIVSEMPEAEKRYAALLQEYYNAYSKERINQTSMELDGYERAMEDNYYPIVSDENYLKSTAAVYDGSINGTGSLQERLHASNPILLSDADSVYRWHRDMMSRYYGLAIPIRNFEMTLNYAEKGFNGSFKEELEQTWGKNAAKYLDDLLVELNGMKAREDRGRFGGKLDAATSNTTNAVLSFNLSSLGKQFAAYPSSAAVLGWDSLAHGLKLWEKVDTDLVSAYTPLLDWRAQGYATQELADYTRTKGALPKSKLGKTLSGVNWLTAADQAVVKRLWAASEYYVKKNTDLTPGSNPMDGNDPYYKAVAEIFQDTISKTQSMSTMMHRTNISKTPKGRLVTYMKGDALQKGGFLFEKAGELNRLNREFKQNPTAENKKAFIDAKRAMARTASAFIADAAFVTLVSLAMTHDKDKWRDEEGKLTFESAGKQYIKEMAGGLSGMAVFGENIYNAIDAAFFGGTVYDAVFPGLDAGNKTFQQIIDTVGSTSDFFVGMGDIISNGGSIPEYVANEGSGAVGLLKDTAIGIGSLFGIPASNMEKYTLKALYAAAPNLAAQYENFFNRTGKADLKGLYGNKLQARLGTAISNRIKDVEPATKQEIHRLYQAENGEVIPVEVPKTVSVDGVEVTLTPYKKQVYEDTFDLTVGNSLDTLVSSDYYSLLDDNDRVKAIKYLYDYADAVAKEKSVGRPLSGWMENAKSMVDDGLNVEKYLQFKLATDEYTSEDGKVKTQKVDWLKNSGFSETSQSIIFFNSIASDKQLEACSHLADEYGVRKTDYYNFIAGTNGFEPEKNSDGKSINGSLDMKYMAYINSMNISEEQKVQMFLSSANSESLVKNFNEKVQEAKRIGINEMELAQFYCVSYATASDKDSNGETITGSKQNKVWAFIDSLDMSNAQKNFLHLCSYSAKSLGKAPWNSGRNLSGYMPSFPYIKGISSKTAKKTTRPKSNVLIPDLKGTVPVGSKTSVNQTGSSTNNGINNQKKTPVLQFLPTAKEDLAKGVVKFK